MRVIAGRFRGHPLRAPAGARTRPTADRVREALFALLGDLAGLRVLDLFAGTGALGLEALSRGAARATFVEASRPARAALGQTQCMEAPAVFIWTAVFQRTKWKYGQRAYRYIYLDAGHIAENLALAAVSLGLGSCQIGALFDEEINQIIGVDGKEESVLYMTVTGYGVD